MPSPRTSPPPFRYAPRPNCICGAALTKDARRREVRTGPGDVRFLRCRACGSWCQSPQIEPASLADWYDSDAYQGSGKVEGGAYANYEADEPSRRIEAVERVRRDVMPHLDRRPARVLEIGCASGSVLAALRDAGHEVLGVDLSPRFAEQARRLNGIDILVGDFAAMDLPSASFDAVLLLGTASNLPDLPASLRRMRGLLRSDGWILLNFPAADSLTAQLYGSAFWMFAPSAATFASAEGIRRCARNQGFEIAELRRDRQRPSYQKLFKHARLGRLLPSALSAGRPPFRFPVPSVRLARLRMQAGR